jgi:2-polyprenyl-3-methyl-5-hydroxy-6-metoxy-1,4-benzoquinol methylase
MTSESNPRRCPVCGSRNSHQIFRQHFISGVMGNGYTVVVCSQCGAGFAVGIPSQQRMDLYYAEQSKYTYDHAGGAESPWDFKRFKATVKQLTPYITDSNARILDIGCATGGLLSVLRESGFGNVIGADPSPACAATAKRLYGIDVRTASFTDTQMWTEQFDIVLMLGVLEHLVDVKDSIAAASRLLKQNGILYCAVPDVEGLADCANAPFQQFSLEHVNFFSTQSLSNLMAGSGFVCEQDWRWVVEWRKNVFEPIASGVYRRGLPLPYKYDTKTEASLVRYIEFSESEDKKIQGVIDALLRDQRPILVWGAGTLARRLLATNRLADVNIRAFVDSSSLLQGQMLAGRKILAPEEIRDRSEDILICSRTVDREITDVIRTQYGFPNALIYFS